jgi:HK97 family phage prohead protease
MDKIYVRAFCERADTPGQDGSPIRFIASTEGLARDGLIIDSGGWKLDAYRSNPVVLWAHDYMGQHLPIGKAVTVNVEEARLVADVQFDQADEFARSIERKYRQGYLNAVSVGWNTLAVKPSKAGAAPRITEAELLDISAVPVPGDPEALIERQYAALRSYFESETTSPDGEGTWRDTAGRMVRLFVAVPDDLGDEARLKQYKALLPAYRRSGKVAPEFRATTDIGALGLDELRGLFLEDEPELYPEMFLETSTRKGAMLSKRNRDDLEQAISLINGVLERAKKEEEPPEETTDEEPERGQDELLAHLINLKLRLGEL